MKFRKIAYGIILVLLIVIFLFSGFYVWTYLRDSKEQKDAYNNLAALVESAREEEKKEPAGEQSTEPGETRDPDASTEPESLILPEYQTLYEKNPDLVGWITIDDTTVNYPVVQTPDDPEYYLYRNFDRERNIHGCLFVGDGGDVFTPSDNLIIYGHHMRDGSMFGSLEKYLRKAYWEEHSTLRFDTLTERHSYEIFAVFKTTASVGEGFAYHHFLNAADEAEFDEFVETCIELGRDYYTTGIVPEYGDKLICLSTCEYTRENGRLVVAAVRTD